MIKSSDLDRFFLRRIGDPIHYSDKVPPLWIVERRLVQCQGGISAAYGAQQIGVTALVIVYQTAIARGEEPGLVLAEVMFDKNCKYKVGDLAMLAWSASAGEERICRYCIVARDIQDTGQAVQVKYHVSAQHRDGNCSTMLVMGEVELL